MSNEENSVQTPAAIDASCRLPVLLLLASATAWLVTALGFGLFASLNFHAPGLLADCPNLTYGHRASVAWTAMLFGFGGNAALGITLWMLARLRGVNLRWPALAALGAALWNVGVTAGVWGFLMGDGTGHGAVDIPLYAVRVLILGGALMAIPAGLTYFARRDSQLYVSTWHLIGGLVVLPWVLVTIYLLLGNESVRGVAQATIAWWAASSLTQVWLGMVGLAVVYYFTPKILDCPLYSRQLAVLGFLGILVLGGFLGVHAGAPVPVWIVRLSAFAAVLFAFPLFAVWWNVRRTVGIRPFATSTDNTLAFVGVAWVCFLVAGVGTVLHPWINGQTHFTIFESATRQLFVFGFFGMAATGAIHYIVPRLVGAEWCCQKAFRRIYLLAGAGLLLYVVPMIYGGIDQGRVLNAGDEYINLPSTALMGMRIAFLGELAMFFAALGLMGNVFWAVIANCCEGCNPVEIFRMMKAAREEGETE
tara:strand:+ start:382 stop:1812 length:1431 start_codon:yes stop_codon:yes gene_type:complete